MVAMVDPPTVVARPVPRAIIGLMKPIVSPYLLRWTYELMARLERFFMARTSKQITIAKLHNALFNSSYDEIPPALWDAYSIAMAHYLPAPLELPVTFYAADYEGRAWRHLSSQLEVVQVPGGHRGCLTIGAELLVDHLRQRIDVLADVEPPSLKPHTSAGYAPRVVEGRA
jgi:hypothetical protein